MLRAEGLRVYDFYGVRLSELKGMLSFGTEVGLGFRVRVYRVYRVYRENRV